MEGVGESPPFFYLVDFNSNFEIKSPIFRDGNRQTSNPPRPTRQGKKEQNSIINRFNYVLAI